MAHSAIERLRVQQACQDTVVATARVVDAQDPPALALLFTPDGVLVRSDGQAAPCQLPRAPLSAQGAGVLGW